MKFFRYIRQRAYRWHRVTSLVVALPILLWTVSGFLHPVVNSNALKPKVMNSSLPPAVLDTAKMRLSIREALEAHRIERIEKFRIVKLYGGFYYQVKLEGKDTLSYISCYNAQWLPKGDEQYAGWLATRFLSDPNGNGNNGSHHGSPVAADVTALLNREATVHHDRPNIGDIKLIKSFDLEYKKSNVLLPVYRVEFYRSDNIRLYVETSTDKLAASIDQKKAWFNVFFAQTHSWAFLDGLGWGKNVIVGCFSLLCFISAVLGFCVYNILPKHRRRSGQPKRNRHRKLGNVFVLATALFALSGGWHAFHKLSPEAEKKSLATVFETSRLNLDPSGLHQLVDAEDTITSVSAVRIGEEEYWQVSSIANKKFKRSYVHMMTGEKLENGEDKYGRYLVAALSGQPETDIIHSKQIRSYNNRYSMMQRRLPVTEVSFDGKTFYYAETSTNTLAAVVDQSDEAERFSFSNLHMHHYWEDWLGKNVGKTAKNIVLISSTLGLLMLALTGMMIYWSKKRKARVSH